MQLIRTWVAALALLSAVLLAACSKQEPAAPAPAAVEAAVNSRTEFTNRIENYFEYEPMRVGKPSQIRIHLTDLSDGSPVEQAQVTLAMRPKGSAEPVLQTTSRIGKVAGIYVAELTPPKPGDYDIDFHIKNEKLDERLPLSNFKVE
jgi:5-hydroxyisourate hydrolase-like protein (transthyretin family)